MLRLEILLLLAGIIDSTLAADSITHAITGISASTLEGESVPIDLESIFGFSPRCNKTFPHLVEYDGYPVQEYYVITEDGYNLTLFRIPMKSSCIDGPNKSPVLFWPGLYLSGDDCIIPGPGKGICYIISDNCHDIWIANPRGNRYSKRHLFLKPKPFSEFWNFAFDEMAKYDVPAVIDKVLAETEKDQLVYIGHSQGVTALLLTCAKIPKYNAKVKRGYGLSVAAWLEHARLPVLPPEALIALFGAQLNQTNNFEVFPHGGLVQKFVQYLCGLSPLQYPLCMILIFFVFGYNRYQISDETLRAIVCHTPAGTSFLDFIRWGGVYKDGFGEVDLGVLRNLEKYHQITPPWFDLSPVTMKWIFLVAQNDYVAHPKDVASLGTKSNLTNFKVCNIPDPDFGHLDFIYSFNIPNYITPTILKYINEEIDECVFYNET